MTHKLGRSCCMFDCQDGKTIDIVSRIPAHRTWIFGWPSRPLCARCTRSSNFVPLLKSNANLLPCAALPKCRFLYLMKGFTGYATELLVSRVKSNQRQMRNAFFSTFKILYLPELMDMGNPPRGNSCGTGGFGIAMDLFCPSRRCWDLWAPKPVHLSSGNSSSAFQSHRSPSQLEWTCSYDTYETYDTYYAFKFGSDLWYQTFGHVLITSMFFFPEEGAQNPAPQVAL